MYLADLHEAVESPTVEAKRLMSSWRTSAADEKYGLTIDSSGTNAANAFPVVRKAGTWYGGVFTPRGGTKKEAERMLSVSVSAKGWIKQVLAPSLEDIIKGGREVRISSSFNGNRDSAFYQSVKVVKPGTVAEALLQHLVPKKHVTGERLGVCWWVSTPETSRNTSILNLSISWGEPHKPAKNAHGLIQLPKEEARALASSISDLKQNEPQTAKKLALELLKHLDPSSDFKLGDLIFLSTEIGNAAKAFTRLDNEATLAILKKYV